MTIASTRKPIRASAVPASDSRTRDHTTPDVADSYPSAARFLLSSVPPSSQPRNPKPRSAGKRAGGVPPTAQTTLRSSSFRVCFGRRRRRVSSSNSSGSPVRPPARLCAPIGLVSWRERPRACCDSWLQKRQAEWPIFLWIPVPGWPWAHPGCHELVFRQVVHSNAARREPPEEND